MLSAKAVKSGAKRLQESLSFSASIHSQRWICRSGSSKYWVMAAATLSGVHASQTIPVPRAPTVSFSPPTSVTTIGTIKWQATELMPLCVALR